MSFTNRAKGELVRLKLGRKCCQKAELAAFVHMLGHVMLHSRGLELIINAGNPLVARRAFMLLKLAFRLDPELLFRKNIRLKKNNVFIVKVADEFKVPEVLADLGLYRENKLIIDRLVDDRLIKRKCCRRAYLRGAFVASGYIINPESAYHLEIVTEYEAYSRRIAELMAMFGLSARTCVRKHDNVVYLKGSESIGEFLRIVGAGAALLEYENIRILKGMRNRVNRLVNCETANMDKTVEAAQKQIDNIYLIDRCLGLEKLPASLQRIAELRLQHPEASLRELGQLFAPPLGKSGVNHRLRRLEKIAHHLREE